ncbi:MAG: MFS transporter [Maricaulaceae bacterium]
MLMKGNLRWVVVGLVALATVINYIDRQAITVLWPAQMAPDMFPDMDADGHKAILAIISSVFIFAYAFGQAIFGKIFDWVGTRIGFALSIGIWSVATALHAFAKGVWTLSIFRALLGVAEAGNWPGAAKANAEWFPTKERAFAQGIFNSGAAIGGIIAIPLIGYLSIYMDWKMVFILIGVLGLLWLIPWLVIVKAPPKAHSWLSEDERQYILSGQISEDVDGDGVADEYDPSTGELLSRKQSWGVIVASAAIDPIWWLFIVWIPTYLFEVHGYNVKDLVASGWVPFVGAMFGAWFGGLLAQNRLSSGWNVDKTRKFVITLGCLIMLPSLLAMSITGDAGVLAVFGVDASITTLFQDTHVKTMLSNETVKMTMENADIVKQLAGLDAAAIMADPNVTSMLSDPKLVEAMSNDVKLAAAITPETLTALGSFEAIDHAKTVAATLSVSLMFIILFGFQTAIGNVQTLPSDFLGRKAVGSLSGFAGMAAKLTAFALTLLVPIMTKGANYTSVFILGAILALTAIAAIWFLCGKIEPLKPRGSKSAQ